MDDDEERAAIPAPPARGPLDRALDSIEAVRHNTAPVDDRLAALSDALTHVVEVTVTLTQAIAAGLRP